jgi:hypothetical protein
VWGLYCRKDWGPSFGNTELEFDYTLNGKGKCRSLVNQQAYKIPKVNGDINQLTNEKCDKYGRSRSTIREIEVWEIIGKK